MGIAYNPRIVTDGLVFALDAGNTKSLTKVSRKNLLLWSNKLNRPHASPFGTDYYGGGYFDGWQNDPADITESDDGYGTYYTTTNNLVWSAYYTVDTAPFTVYTISFLAKSDTIANIRPRLYSNIDGTKSTGDWQSLQTDGTLSLNGWRQFTFVMPATIANNPEYPYPENPNGHSLVIELSTGSGFSIKNIQVEEGSLATEYIPTLGSSVSIVGYVPTWKDLSGNGNNGTITNSVLYAPTYNSSNGGSLVFDGVDDYVQINGSITLSEATFIAWIKRNGDQPDYTGIIYNRISPANATGLDLSGISVPFDVYNPINQVNYTWNGAVNTFSWDSGLLIPDFTWCMIAVSVTSTSATAYLCQPSGITSSTNVVNHAPATLSNIKIGVDDFTLENRSFKGDIAQASIYNRALTSSEIQQIYIATKSRYDTVEDIVTSGLVLNLDAGNIESYPRTGTTWTDLSGSGNNGTLINGPTYSNGAIVFDGTNDYASLSPSTRYTTLTMEVWFNTTTISLQRQYLYTQQTNPPTLTEFTYQQRQGCQISYDKVTFQYLNTDNTSFYVDTTPSIQPNTWYQFVAVLNGSSYQLYLNGSPVSMTPNILINQYVNTNTNSKVFTPNQAYIGYRGDAEGNDRFNGKISIVREYNRALTASEIKYNFNVTRSRYGI